MGIAGGGHHGIGEIPRRAGQRDSAHEDRHIIKRYLKRVGFKTLKVEHLSDAGPFTLKLVAHGLTSIPITQDQLAKLQYLRSLCCRLLLTISWGTSPMHRRRTRTPQADAREGGAQPEQDLLHDRLGRFSFAYHGTAVAVVAHRRLRPGDPS